MMTMPTDKQVENERIRIAESCDPGLSFAENNVPECIRMNSEAVLFAALAYNVARLAALPPRLPEHDNHHNAARCPYCIPSEELRDALRDLDASELLNAVKFYQDAQKKVSDARLLESQTIDHQRTLADYRPQHDWGCSSRTCRCGYKHAGKRCATSGNHEFHDFDPWPCTCGLDALIAAVRRSGEPTR